MNVPPDGLVASKKLLQVCQSGGWINRWCEVDSVHPTNQEVLDTVICLARSPGARCNAISYGGEDIP